MFSLSSRTAFSFYITV